MKIPEYIKVQAVRDICKHTSKSDIKAQLQSILNLTGQSNLYQSKVSKQKILIQISKKNVKL